MFAGKVLADAGCDVLRMSPPGGDPYRAAPPLVPWGGEQVSAMWLAYNTSKRSAEIDIASAAGRVAFEALVDGADVVIASGPAAVLAAAGLTPAALRQGRPGLVAVAITPWGLSGPHRDWAATDLVLQAAGGMAFLNGDEDRPPVRISEEMVWPMAGSQAAFAAVTALFAAGQSGGGEGIDLSMQECVAAALVVVDPWWQLEGRDALRRARFRVGRDLAVRMVWPCKDGFVTYRLSFGQGLGNRNLHLIRWMEEEGMDQGLLEVPWEYISTLELTQEQIDDYQARIERFFRMKTRTELYRGALARRMMLFPVWEPAAMLADEQLAARQFWTPIADSAGRKAQFPGALFRAVPGYDPRPLPPPSPGAHTAEALAEARARPARPSRTSPPAGSVGAGLLSGVTIADFGWAVAGPALSRFLAHHGATVIKIESNARLDPTRMSPPFAAGPSRNGSGYFDRFSAGKKSVTFNLEHPEGRRLAFALATAADAVNENFAPGVLDAKGLGYEALRAVRPDVVMISSGTQGQTGPNAGHPGLGVTLQGLVGLAHITGWPDREPLGPGEPYTDTLVPWLAGAALVTALDYRRRTGTGAHVDVSQFETVAHFLAPALLDGQLAGREHIRRGNSSPVRAPEGIYPCAGAERWVAISVEDDAQWRALAERIGADPGATRAWRLAHDAEVDALVAAWTAQRAAEAVQDELQAIGVAAHRVTRARDLFDDAQLAARDHWVRLDHPSIGPHFYEMPPFRLDGHAITMARSPKIGEHTDEVLRDVLGLTPPEIERLREAGALS